MNKLKSFADIPRDALITRIDATPAPKQFVPWTVTELPGHPIEPYQVMSICIVRQATETLNKWLEARLRDLMREGVNQNEIAVQHQGSRTIIRVRGVDRYEFKLKIIMGQP